MLQHLRNLDNQALLRLFVRSLWQTFLFIFLYNIINLIAELVKINYQKEWSVSFNHGYFTVNDNPVGYNIFANIAGLLFVLAVILYYNVNLDHKKMVI